MATCTRCGRPAGFMMSLCSNCIREKTPESVERAKQVVEQQAARAGAAQEGADAEAPPTEPVLTKGPRLGLLGWALAGGVVLCFVLGGLLLAAHRSGGPFRVVLFDAGNGQGAMDIEKLSNVTISFTFDGGIQLQPVWEQRDADVVVEHDLEFNNRKWRAGERLTSDGERLVPQSLRRRLWNDVRYAVWRFEQPNHGKRQQLWIRARAVRLRGQAGESTGPERGQVKFGDRVEVLERGADDWMNVADLSTRRRGWIHSVVTTGDASQIERLRREDSAPALILRMEARSAQEISGLTVAGFLVADANLETQSQVNDCVMFGVASLQHFPKPTRIHGLTIDEPRADKLYCVDSSHGLKVRDLASLL